MKIQKIVIVGNSVAIRNRPHDNATSKNYGQIIEEKLNTNSEQLTLVRNLGFTRATMYDLHKVYPEIINNFGDIYILNIGSSDAATREIPRWYADYLFSNKRSFTVRILKGFHELVIKPIRRYLVVLRGKRAWTSARVFREEYIKLINTIQKNTHGKIICLSINIPNERIEREVPGSTKNYKKFNQIIKDISLERNCMFLSMDDLEVDTHYPDGTHFSERGNEEVANRLLDIIQQIK